ncbi:MAG: single-stranded DNA-binding protein [bacterium]|nr:single-stranded DNA-binding protein [bacterium]
MASRSLNRAILIGNLTRDPELKYTPAGTAVCTFGVATNRSWTTQDGQTKEETQYHRIVAWQKLAELCGKLLTKGRKVYLEGRITYRTFTGKDGQQRSITEIVLDDFIVFSDGKRVMSDEKPVEKTSTPEASATEVAVTPETSTDTTGTENVSPDDIPF